MLSYKYTFINTYAFSLAVSLISTYISSSDVWNGKECKVQLSKCIKMGYGHKGDSLDDED